MIEAAPTDARAALLTLIDVAAPGPVPAEQAIALLRQVQGEDVESLARLAYQALTGHDPASAGEVLPQPTALVPGFPVFVSEVLVRAIQGPEDRRPTSQALLVVLETVPASQWPASAPVDVAEVEAEEEAAEAAEAVDTVEAAEAAAADTVEAVEPEAESSRLHEDFHQLVAPGHAVPQFDPLDGAGELPGSARDGRVRRRRSVSGPSAEERRQTLIWVAAIAVLILLALYAAR